MKGFCRQGKQHSIGEKQNVPGWSKLIKRTGTPKGIYTLRNTLCIFEHFGNLAVVVSGTVRSETVDPWLCVPAFRRVCYYRTIFRILSKIVEITTYIWSISDMMKITFYICFSRKQAMENLGYQRRQLNWNAEYKIIKVTFLHLGCTDYVIREMMLIRRLLYFPILLVYRYIYAPVADLVDRYKHRNDPPLPPVPCQICGKPGHKERYCPSARMLGFWSE